MSLICAPSSLLSVIYCFLSNYFRILYLFCACDVVRCSSCLCCCFLLLLFFCFLCPSVFHMCSITVLLLSHCFLLSLFYVLQYFKCSITVSFLLLFSALRMFLLLFFRLLCTSYQFIRSNVLRRVSRACGAGTSVTGST